MHKKKNTTNTDGHGMDNIPNLGLFPFQEKTYFDGCSTLQLINS